VCWHREHLLYQRLQSPKRSSPCATSAPNECLRLHQCPERQPSFQPKAARELKGRFPMLQIKIYDAENKRIEEIELAAA
jgi:hypothetical protein